VCVARLLLVGVNSFDYLADGPFVGFLRLRLLQLYEDGDRVRK
jgi:hypothetical protein